MGCRERWERVLQQHGIVTVTLVVLWGSAPGLAIGQARETGRPALMPPEEEAVLALGAAPEHLRDGAGVYVLRESGYVRLRESRNGFTCIVNRDHPRAIKPTCWDAEGTRTIVPRVLRVGELLMQGETPEKIEREIQEGFRTGRFESPARPGVAYMLSPHIRNVDFATGAERRFPPHVMFYAPGLTNADIGTGESVAEGLPFIDYQGPHGYMIVMPKRPGPAAWPADHAPIRVGTATGRPGSVVHGVLPVRAGRDAGIEVPVTVVQGTRPGPTLAIVSGLHGTEYAGTLALLRLVRELDPATLTGTVIVVPIANVAAFEGTSVRVNPVDRKNMNRTFPGDSMGTQSERVAHRIHTDVLQQSDYVIDVHGGDVDESLRPYLFALLTGVPAQDEVTMRMALATGYDHIIRYPVPLGDVRGATMLATASAALGKPTITIEAGDAGTSRAEDVAMLLEGFRGTLGAAGMIAYPGRTAGTPVLIDRTAFVTSEWTGLFRPTVVKGAAVAAGTVIGIVTDYRGEGPQEVRAPAAGVVLYIRSVPSIVKGGQVAFIGELPATMP